MKRNVISFSGVWLLIVSVIFFAGSVQAQKKLTKEEKTRVIEQTSQLLNESYVFPEIAKKIETHLKAKIKEGAFDTINSKESFARVMSSELYSVSKDKHMRMRVKPPPVDQSTAEDPMLDNILRQKQYAKSNNGFMKVEILPGNVGYVDFRRFTDPEEGRETASAALDFLSNTDAIIFDIRKNGGGSPEMVQYICSYFFDEPTHLNSLYWRRGDQTVEYWTHDDIDGKKRPDLPLFILTARRTFSGAEEFAYNMQTRERATLIGEVTGGGANPGGTRVVGGDYWLFIPTGRAINPVTGTNWEGVGVVPEIEVDADSALDIALEKAKTAAEKYDEKKKQRIISNYNKSKGFFNKATTLFESGRNDEAEKLVFKGLNNGVDHGFLEEYTINDIGYDYLGEEKFRMAIAVFKFNVKHYPGSSNTYDSLGEAYLESGNKKLALKYYSIAFKMDPENINAGRIVKELQDKE